MDIFCQLEIIKKSNRYGYGYGYIPNNDEFAVRINAALELYRQKMDIEMISLLYFNKLCNK